MTIEEFEKVTFKSCFLLPNQIQWSYKYTTPQAPASHLEYKITSVFPTEISWSDISVEEYKELEQINKNFHMYQVKKIVEEMKLKKIEEDF